MHKTGIIKRKKYCDFNNIAIYCQALNVTILKLQDVVCNSHGCSARQTWKRIVVTTCCHICSQIHIGVGLFSSIGLADFLHFHKKKISFSTKLVEKISGRPCRSSHGRTTVWTFPLLQRYVQCTTNYSTKVQRSFNQVSLNDKSRDDSVVVKEKCWSTYCLLPGW